MKKRPQKDKTAGNNHFDFYIAILHFNFLFLVKQALLFAL